MNRWRGLEVNGFVLEEANELQERSFLKAIERAGAWIIPNGKAFPPPIIMLTCNPAQGWVKQRFYNPWKMGALSIPYYYLPARADDNPYVPEEQKRSWRELPEAEYKRFVEGDWDVSDDPRQLVKFEWIHQALNAETQGGGSKMGIDVARYGDDKTVFAYMIGDALIDIEEYDGYSIDRTSDTAGARIQERAIPADMVGVDVVGLGAGVADNLRGAGYNVRDIVSGAAAVEIKGETTAYSFKNLRSQMWWYTREKLRRGDVCLSVRHQKLIDDLLAPHYRMTGDKVIEVESKDQIKKRLGRSTDYGDAFVYALFVEHVPKNEPTMPRIVSIF